MAVTSDRMHSAHQIKGRKGDSRQREQHVQGHHLGVKEYCLFG